MIRASTLIGMAFVTTAIALASSAAAQCADDTDCRAGRTCKKGQCIEVTCSKDVDCPHEGLCEAGVCKARVATPFVPPAATPAPAPPASPTAYRTESRLIPGLYVTGPVVFGAAYLIGIGVTAAVADPSDPNHGKYIAVASIPIVGPWIMVGFKGTDEHKFGGDNPGLARGAAVSIGILQAAGLGMTIAGFTVHREVKVPVLGTATLTLVPTGSGAAAFGTF